MKHTLYLIIILIARVPAAFERIPQSPLATGSAFSFFLPTGSSTDFLSHPAGLSHLHGIALSAFNSSPFQMAALNQNGITLAVPLNSSVLGAGFATLGRTQYQETVVTVGAGRETGTDLDAGILLSFVELYIANYGTDRTFAMTVSASYALAEGAQWSLLYRNLNRPRVGRSREILPQVISTGLTFSPLASVTSTFELENDLAFKNRYKFGLRWQPLSHITSATGFATHPAQFTAGIALQFTRLNPSYEVRISYGLATHPELAISQVVSLQLGLR